MRISLGLLTRITNEQILDDIILRFGFSLIRITPHSHLGPGVQLLSNLPVKASLNSYGFGLRLSPTLRCV